MSANPDELKKDELIEYLEDKENPLPGYMIDILEQVATGTTYKTVLQKEMAHYNRLKTRAAHDMIRSLVNDTVLNTGELRNWLDNLGGKRADEQIIETYLAEGNTADALTLAGLIPQMYAMNVVAADRYGNTVRRTPPGEHRIMNDEITDATGQTIKTVEVTGTQGQYVWDTRKVEPGVYFYTFDANGKQKTGKLVIVK